MPEVWVTGLLLGQLVSDEMMLKGWRDELMSIVAPGFDPAGQVLKPEGWKPKSCKKPN